MQAGIWQGPEGIALRFFWAALPSQNEQALNPAAAMPQAQGEARQKSHTMTITKHTQPIKSGWPSFDVCPPKPKPHWSFQPSAARRLRRVQSAIDCSLSSIAKALEMRRLAAMD